MSLELTPALSIAWNRAVAIALAEERDSVEPLDLLRGLLAEEEGHAAQSLAEAGLDLSAWTFRFPDDARREPAEQRLPASPAMRLVMTRAQRESGQLTEEGSLSSDQVLAAVMALAEGAVGALAACGFDLDRWKRIRPAEPEAIALDEPLDLSEPSDQAGAARIVDAAANRAREALRVLEDHARFVLDDALLSRTCKELRHALAAALDELPDLLASRDTVGDVGTSISTPSESDRGSLASVLAANAKRLQESLRSLEEYGKVLSPLAGEAIEKIRYRSYTLEKACVLGSDSRERLASARLYALVSRDGCVGSLVGTVRELCEGGVHVIQLREKTMADRDLLAAARDVRELTRRFGVLFIVNDRPDLAILADADGVHLGQDDLPLREARRIVGGRILIGVSTHTIDQVRSAVFEGASYIGVGPTFPSKTKSFDALAGLEFVREAMAETSLPAFAIGGITAENLQEAIAAGARRVAMSHALCGVENPKQAAGKIAGMLR